MSDNNIISSDDSFSKNDYMPQLDSLRTFAVVCVLISHWMIKSRWNEIIPFAEMGVLLFFVLSGFLISGILLRSRLVDEEKNKSKFYSLKQFYIRRTLRIFPVYYITILVLYLIDFPYLKPNTHYYLSYTVNVLYFNTESWGGALSPLWTLSVEEQFYVIWPWIILFIPKKHLLKTILGIILIGPVFRGLVFYYLADTPRSFFINLLTPSCIDCFGLGALLAYFRVYKNQPFTFNKILSKVFLLFNIILLILLVFFPKYLYNVFPFKYDFAVISQMLTRLCFSIFFLFIIAKASIGFKGILKIILENKILVYLGKISYGMYLFHNFIPKLYYDMHLPYFENIILRQLGFYLLLTLIATVSWYLIEKPINNLKKNFNYT